MTHKDQIKILDDKIKASERQYDSDRMNAERSAYSSGDLPKYEYLTKKDLEYKPDAVEKVKFEYSPIGKVFTDGLSKENKSKKVGLFKRLKNIEDNLVEADDNDNKVGIFRIIKDIKDRGIKIDNDDEAVREIRERIKELIDDEVKVNNFDEMKKEIIEHVKNLKNQGANVKVEEDQINDLISKIFDKNYEKYDKKTCIESEIDKFLEKYEDKNISTSYDDDGDKIKFDTEKIIKLLKKLRNKFINLDEFNEEYNKFKDNVVKLENFKSKKTKGSIFQNQIEIIRHERDLNYIADLYNVKSGSDTSKNGEGLKILTNKQMLNRLPILLDQIQAGNNSKSLKNELRQILYSLYRSKLLTKTVHTNLIKSIPA